MAETADIKFSAVWNVKEAVSQINTMSKKFLGLGQTAKKINFDSFEKQYNSFNKINRALDVYGKFLNKSEFGSKRFLDTQTKIDRLNKLREKFNKKDGDFSKKNITSMSDINDALKENREMLKEIVDVTKQLINSQNKSSSNNEKNSKQIKQNANDSQSGLQKISAFTIATGNLISSSLISGFGLLKQGIMDAIPAMGQTFDMAKQVIIRNIAMPIAQTVMPLLVQMMNWVRDNRLQFVRFGVAVLEGFQMVWGVVKGFFDLVKIGFNAFNKSIGGVQISFDKVMKFFQLVMFKVSTLIAFILILLEPIIEKLGAAFGNIYYKAIKPFIDGLMNAFNERITGSVRKFAGLLDNLATIFLNLTGVLDGTEGSFYNLGNTIGGMLFDAIDGVVWILTEFTNALLDPDGQMIALGVTVGVLAGALKVVGIGFLFAKAKMLLFNGVMAVTNALASVNPFIIIGLAVVGLTVALYKLYKNWDKVVAYMNENFDVSNRFQKLKADILSGWNEISGRFNRWVDSVRLGWNEIKERARSFIDEVTNSWDELWNFASSKWEGFSDGLTEGWDMIVNIFNVTIKKLKKWFKELWESALGWFNDFGTKLKNNAVWQWISGKIGQLRADVSAINSAQNEKTKKEEELKSSAKQELPKPLTPKYASFEDIPKEKREAYFDKHFHGWWSDANKRQTLEYFNALEGRATGGNVYSNTPYIVGERGAELFVPKQSGSIIPNNKLEPRLRATGTAHQKDNGDIYTDNRHININIVGTNLNTEQIASAVKRELEKKPNYSRDFFASQTKYGRL